MSIGVGKENVETGYQYDLTMPKQKVPYSKKDENWRKKCIDACIHMSGLHRNSRRSTRLQKQKNYDLFNGKINKQDLEYAINPLGIEVSNMTFPATIQPYDVWSPIFMELFGEEARRPLSFIVACTNEDAVSEKQNQIKQLVTQRLTEIITDSSPEYQDKQVLEQKLASIDKLKMSYQDIRESIASSILQYLKRDLNLDMTFSKGWEDVLIAGEEIYAVEEISNEPKVRRVNPLECTFVLPHNQDIIDNSDIVVEMTYMSISQIIDNFYEDLSEDEITHLETQPLSGAQGYQIYADVIIYEKGFMPEFMHEASPVYDARGNIRVVKVVWNSKKKIGCLYYINPLTGEQEETEVSEDYKPVKGEIVIWKWINEYWEGYKIGQDIYLSIKPRKQQFRRMDNLSSNKSGYVGAVYNANNSRSVSLMDRLRPFIHLYVITFYNTELAMATNLGKIALIDTDLIPDGWEVDKWLHYARIMKVAFVSSFNEGKKGQATGKLAGNFNQNRELNLEAGNYIQQHVQILEMLEGKIRDLAGVPRQRLGATFASDAVRNNQSALEQASYVTEKWFQVHNWTKQRVLTQLIEVAKKCWEGKSKKLQYITSEMTQAFIDVDMNEFINSEFGVFVTNSAEDKEVLNTMKQLMHAAIQSDKATLSDVISVLNSESIASMRTKLLESEANFHQRQQELEKLRNQPTLQAEQIRDKRERDKLENDSMNKQLDRDKDIEVAQIKAYGAAMLGMKDADLNDNNIPDILEIEKLHQKTAVDNKKLQLDSDKLKLEREKLKHSSSEAQKDRDHEEEMQKKDHKIDIRDIEAKLKAAKAKQKLKPKK